MKRTEKPPASAGSKGFIWRLADLWTLFWAAVTVIAFISNEAASLARPIAIGLAVSLIAIGATEMLGRRHCRRAPRPGVERLGEEGIDRLCILAGAIQLVAAVIAPPVLACPIGAALTLTVVGAGTRRPTRIRAFSGRRWRGRVRASILALAVSATVFLAYAGLSVALIASEVADGSETPDGSRQRGQHRQAPGETEVRAGEGARLGEEPLPTYEESCPELPDPALIGHGLGELFERDGAPKAGCGSMPVEVPRTGAWAAAGICEGELRSVAVAGREGSAVMLYGLPAEFAWEEARAGNLVGAEAAYPAAGDVDLVETLRGTYGFARSSRSIRPGKEELRWCGEASGLARPFVQLPPPLLFLWLELLEHRAAWSWPVADSTDSDGSVAFAGYPGEELIAIGGCETDTDCHLLVDGKRWPNEGTAYVSVPELQPYMPPHGG